MQAKRKPLSFHNPQFNQQLLWAPGPLYGHDENTAISENDQSPENLDKLLQACEPVESFLEFKNFFNQLELESSSLNVSSGVSEASEKTILGSLSQYTVPLSLIERWGNAMGILRLFF